MLSGEVHHLSHLGLRHLVSEHPAYADTAAVYVQHDPGRLLARLGEEPLQNVNDELHGSVVVVQHEDLVHRRFLRLRLGLDDDAGVWSLTIAFLRIAHGRSTNRHIMRFHYGMILVSSGSGEGAFPSTAARRAPDPPRLCSHSMPPPRLTAP